MDDDAWLVDRFEEHRPRLRAVAQRMLGNTGDADDVVQEAWIRLARSDAGAVENLGGWLTTVVARVSLDMLRSRSSRRDEPSGSRPPDELVTTATVGDPEHEAAVADSVGAALLVVLDTLSPAERLAFVLHDTFAVPFDEIAAILDRSPNAVKQLASRARHKVRGSDGTADRDPARERAVVEAFLAASREGRFDALVALLDPEIVLRADAAAVQMGAPGEVRGAAGVAGMFSGRALGAQPALLDGAIGMAWIVAGKPKVAWALVIVDDMVVDIEMIAASDHLDGLAMALFD